MSTTRTIRQNEWCKLEILENSGTIFLLTLTNKNNKKKDQHLLNPSLISSIRELLGNVKSQATRGSVLITTSEGESFCRGFDFRYARDGGSDEAHKDRFFDMIDLFKDLVADLISLPMPTVAAINGYATGAGLMLGISHDYLTMKPGIDSLRSDHLSMEMSLPPYFAALIRSKVGSPLAQRRLVLRDLQFDTKGAAEIGVLDEEHGVENDAVEAAKALAEKLLHSDRNGEVYAELRKALYPELCKKLGLTCTPILPKFQSRSNLSELDRTSQLDQKPSRHKVRSHPKPEIPETPVKGEQKRPRR